MDEGLSLKTLLLTYRRYYSTIVVVVVVFVLERIGCEDADVDDVMLTWEGGGATG